MKPDNKPLKPQRHLLAAFGLGALGLIVLIATGVAKEKASCGKSASPAGDLAPTGALVGAKAPNFTLKSLDGKTVSLTDFKGKTVVLEWFNPDCPFVNLAHSRTLSMKGKAKHYREKGVVWLAINSNGPGKQGYEKSANQAGRSRFGIAYPILLDPTGKVGKAYGAKRTPEFFVIDKTGVVAYHGAIDNTRGGDASDAEPPPAENYVDAALTALLSNSPPVVRETLPWGCSVKYSE